MKRLILSLGIGCLFWIASPVHGESPLSPRNFWPLKSRQESAPTIKKRALPPADLVGGHERDPANLSPAGVVSAVGRGTQAVVAGTQSAWRGFRRWGGRLASTWPKPGPQAKLAAGPNAVAGTGDAGPVEDPKPTASARLASLLKFPSPARESKTDDLKDPALSLRQTDF
jgi:hypothetical protein